MLVELAIKDAYGAGFEYAQRSFVERGNTLAGCVQHPRHRDVLPGRYTDDTQMSIVVAEWMLGADAGISALADPPHIEDVRNETRRERRRGGNDTGARPGATPEREKAPGDPGPFLS